MSYLDTVKAKREAFAEQQQSGKKDRLLIHTSKKNAETVAGEVARQNARTRLNTQKVEVTNQVTTVKTPDIQAVVKKVDELTKVIKDQKPDDTNLLQAVKELNSTLEKLPSKIDIPTPEKITSVSVDNHPDITPELQGIREAVNGIEVNPIVKVAAPKIPTIDTKPIEKAVDRVGEVIASTKSTEESRIDLKSFIAQEIDNTAPSIEYVGLVNPDGLWEIIEHSIEDNTMRFKFGIGNYGQAWEQRLGHNYKRLDEACSELSA